MLSSRAKPFIGGGKYTSHLLTPAETMENGVPTIGGCRHLVEIVSNETEIWWRIPGVQKQNNIFARIFARAFHFCDFRL